MLLRVICWDYLMFRPKGIKDRQIIQVHRSVTITRCSSWYNYWLSH